MDISKFKTNAEVREEMLQDPVLRADWNRTLLGHTVALRLMRYRADNHLTQTALAKKLGMHQAAIARLESSEHNPSIETLQRLANALGMEFHVQIDVTSTSARVTA